MSSEDNPDPRGNGLLGRTLFRLFKVAPDRHTQARYRALKKLAAQGHAHLLEKEMFAGEMRAKRFYQESPRTMLFWLGWLYDLVSGYGLKFGRPVVAWGLLLLGFAALYLNAADLAPSRPPPAPARHDRAADGAPQSAAAAAVERQIARAARDCRRGAGLDGLGHCGRLWLLRAREAGRYFWARGRSASQTLANRACRHGAGAPLAHAFLLSLSNALIFGGVARSEAASEAQACLYGLAHGISGRPLGREEALALQPGTPVRPIVPVGVHVLIALQTFLSIVLVFLVALAARNRFRAG